MSLLPEDIRFMIACYLFDDVKNLQQVEEFQNILNKDHIWKIWWETFIGGNRRHKSYKTSAEKILNNKYVLDYCFEHGHNIYFSFLLKTRSYPIDVITNLYLETRDKNIQNLLAQHVGGKEVIENHIAKIVRETPGICCPGARGIRGQTGKRGPDTRRF